MILQETSVLDRCSKIPTTTTTTKKILTTEQANIDRKSIFRWEKILIDNLKCKCLRISSLLEEGCFGCFHRQAH